MAGERSVSLPLSMREAVEAIIFRIREAFLRDCNWNPDLACQWFEAEISIKARHSDVGREVKSEFVVQETKGEPPADGSEIVESHAEVNIGMAPPNQVRQETGQGVPVLTTANGRPEIKRVTYKKPGTFEPKA